jgi:hypothetical protein
MAFLAPGRLCELLGGREVHIFRVFERHGCMTRTPVEDLSGLVDLVTEREREGNPRGRDAAVWQ